MFVFGAGEDGPAEAVGEEAGFFVVALGLAAEGGVAAMPDALSQTMTQISQNSRRDTGLSVFTADPKF